MMIFACLVVVSLIMCNDFSRQGRIVAWRGRGLRGSVSEVWTAGHGGVNGRGRGRANLSLWALCVLLICVLCEKKNVFEIRWGVFSLTELTDLTEHFAHSFNLIRDWPLPQPLPRREGRNMWGYPYWPAIRSRGEFFLSQNSQIEQNLSTNVSNSQNASGIQIPQNVIAKGGCWVLVVRCWWLANVGCKVLWNRLT